MILQAPQWLGLQTCNFIDGHCLVAGKIWIPVDFTNQLISLCRGRTEVWRRQQMEGVLGRSHSPFPVFKSHLCSTVCWVLKCEAHKKRFIIEATRHIKSGRWRPWRFKGVQGGWPEASQTQLIRCVAFKKGLLSAKGLSTPQRNDLFALCVMLKRYFKKRFH